jgi:hypothetical protein
MTIALGRVPKDTRRSGALTSKHMGRPCPYRRPYRPLLSD